MLSKSIVLRTHLSLRETEERLSSEIVAMPGRFQFFFGFYPEQNKQFCGSLQDRRLSVTPILGYRNTMRPLIRGELLEDKGGTVIKATATLHQAARGFMKFYNGCLIALFLFILLVLIGILPGQAATWGLLLPPAMMLYGFVLVRVGFWFGCRGAERSLRDLLEAEIDEATETTENCGKGDT